MHNDPKEIRTPRAGQYQYSTSRPFWRKEDRRFLVDISNTMLGNRLISNWLLKVWPGNCERTSSSYTSLVWLRASQFRITIQVYVSRDMTKPTKWVCAQRRLRSAWASAQSDQSLRCLHKESLGPWLPNERKAKTLIRLGGCPDRSLRWAHTHFVGFVMSWLMCTSTCSHDDSEATPVFGSRTNACYRNSGYTRWLEREGWRKFTRSLIFIQSQDRLGRPFYNFKTNDRCLNS